MKKLLFFSLLFLSFQLSAQRTIKNLTGYDRKAVHFGFTVGGNSLNFVSYHNIDLNLSGKVYSIESLGGYGFHVGPVSNFRLGRFFDFRALIDLTFGERALEYTLKDPDNKENPFYKQKVNIESIFIEAPLLLKYKAVRIGNYRPYLIGGVNFKYDLAARKELKQEEVGVNIKLNKLDYYYEIGFGIDYYLPYFKLSTELKYAIGNRNVLEHDGSDLTNFIDALNSKMVVFSLHFE